MKFKAKLKPFQLEGVAFALANPYHINNFEQGLGKTVTALAVAYKLGVKTLVICPAFLKQNWKNEIAKFTEGLDITLISYNALKDTDLSLYGFVVGDEYHYLKNRESLRSEVANRELKPESRPKYFMGLTGTPVSNRVSEFWHLLQLCYYGGSYPEFKPFHRLYFKFCNYFSYERTFEINGHPIVRFDGIRKRKIKELKALISPILIRRRAKDVLDLELATDIDIIGESKKYDEDLEEALDLFNADPNDPQYMSIKRANAVVKAETTIKLAKEFIEQGIRPLVWSCHVDSAEKIAKALKCRVITGKVKPEERQSIIDAFNTGLPTALVCTIGSASTGFNITSTNYSIFNDLPFVPADIEQAQKRIDRIGQDLACFHYFIYLSPFDKKLQDMIKRKSNDIRKIYE